MEITEAEGWLGQNVAGKRVPTGTDWKWEQPTDVKRLLGVEGDFGPKLGLSNDWAYNVIKLVGNYGEIYNRNLGPDTVFNLPRGLNALYTEGGILYAPPIR